MTGRNPFGAHSGLAIRFDVVLAPDHFRAMQISSSLSGIQFNSVYKSVVTRHSAPAVDQVSAKSNESAPSGDDESERVRRESLQLQAAQRSAERTATILSATPEL